VEVAERGSPGEHVDARPEGPPNTIDYVIDFHFLLSKDHWVEGLMASAGDRSSNHPLLSWPPGWSGCSSRSEPSPQ
jgi:hypothetical protein